MSEVYSRRNDDRRGDGQMIPPNYSGSLFGRRQEVCSDCPTVHRAPDPPERVQRDIDPPENCRLPLFGGLRGRGLAFDDILIAALTVLMIASGADDEVILLMILLFVCAFV